MPVVVLDVIAIALSIVALSALAYSRIRARRRRAPVPDADDRCAIAAPPPLVSPSAMPMMPALDADLVDDLAARVCTVVHPDVAVFIKTYCLRYLPNQPAKALEAVHLALGGAPIPDASPDSADALDSLRIIVRLYLTYAQLCAAICTVTDTLTTTTHAAMTIATVTRDNAVTMPEVQLAAKEAATEATHRSQQILLWAIGVAVTAVITLLGLLFSQASTRIDRLRDQVGTTTTRGAPSTTFTTSTPGPTTPTTP